jgi:3,4-dihydroxy-2-butanone 4-phosphate synthase
VAGQVVRAGEQILVTDGTVRVAEGDFVAALLSLAGEDLRNRAY